MNLEDIAKKAGVSRSTVSRVINNSPHVREKTRSRVMQVVDQENFQPNPAARTLVTRRSGIIGVAIPHATNVFHGDNSYYPMLLQGFANAINYRDYAMLLWLSESQEKREDFARRVLSHRQPDGLIIASVIEDDPLFDGLQNNHRLFVMVETPPSRRDETSYVSVDNVAAAEEAVGHLITCGYRRIATITGHLNIRDGHDRLIGYKNALQKAGLPIDDNLIIPGRFERVYGYNGMKNLLRHRPDALFAGCDTIAVGALQALHEAGLTTPDDMAIIGFDDLDIAARYNLTTIRQSIQDIGSSAANLLIDLIEGRLEHPQQITLPTELIVRGTTPIGRDQGGVIAKNNKQY